MAALDGRASGIGPPASSMVPIDQESLAGPDHAAAGNPMHAVSGYGIGAPLGSGGEDRAIWFHCHAP